MLIIFPQVYLTVKYPQQFQLAQAVPENLGALELVPFDNPSSISCPPASTHDNTYIGIIVVGCALAAVIIIIAIRRFRLFKRQKKENPEIATSGPAVPKDPDEEGKYVVIKAEPSESIPSPQPVELQNHTEAKELDHSSPSDFRKFSGTTEFSHARSNSEQLPDQISPIQTGSWS